MSLKIGQKQSSLVIQPSRKRETPPPRVTFRRVMQGGAEILAAGARVASRIVGGPFLAASFSGVDGNLPALGTGPLGIGGGGPQDPIGMLQDQGMSDDLKLLALQDKIQRNNRQFMLISNVMKARHDTAKSAISNIRS